MTGWSSGRKLNCRTPMIVSLCIVRTLPKSFKTPILNVQMNGRYGS